MAKEKGRHRFVSPRKQRVIAFAGGGALVIGVAFGYPTTAAATASADYQCSTVYADRVFIPAPDGSVFTGTHGTEIAALGGVHLNADTWSQDGGKPFTISPQQVKDAQAACHGGGSTTADPGTDNPGTGTDAPGTETDNPGTGTDAPGTETDNPGTGTDAPGTETDNPGTGSSAPSTVSSAPSSPAPTPASSPAPSSGNHGNDNGNGNGGDSGGSGAGSSSSSGSSGSNGSAASSGSGSSGSGNQAVDCPPPAAPPADQVVDQGPVPVQDKMDSSASSVWDNPINGGDVHLHTAN